MTSDIALGRQVHVYYPGDTIGPNKNAHGDSGAGLDGAFQGKITGCVLNMTVSSVSRSNGAVWKDSKLVKTREETKHGLPSEYPGS